MFTEERIHYYNIFSMIREFKHNKDHNYYNIVNAR